MLNWNEIETVLLDMDGTLLDLNFDNYFWLEHLPKRYAQIHQQELEVIKPKLIDQIMAEQGKLSWYSLGFWNEKLDLNLVELKKEVQHLIGYRVDALNFLQQLKLTNKKIILATNADQLSLDLKLPLTGLAQYFDKIHTSASFGFPKEDQGFWLGLQQLENFNPNTSLLIDDNESVLKSAQTFGIQHLISINQPDSTQPKKSSSNFTAISNFTELQLS